MTLTSGMKVGPYEVVAPLGAGGMGEVYRARDARLGRDVAIKVLPASFSSDPDRLRRFEQEARAAGALNHANILAIYDIGTHDGSPFLVTELLDGETLRERLQSGPLPLRKALDVGVQVARGISAAHEKGIVHRDLKPANLFLTTDGRVKILDFGLAKLKQPEGASAGETQAPTKTVDAETEPGIVLGTVGYMSPEQVRGKPADARSDIFSLGTILYEMLSGERPFQRDSSADTMAAILKEDPPELSNEGRKIPPGVERIVRHCLEKDPAERFQSARDLAFDLETLSGTSTAATARGRVAPKSQSQKLLAPIAAALVLLTLGAAGAHFLEKRAGSNPLPTFHQLTFKRGVIYSARFAPDGQTVIYSASWDGEAPQLYSTRPGAPESRPLEVRDSNLFAVSPTGQMALSLSCRIVLIAECGGTLASMPFSGGAPRELAQDVISADWTADGNNLAVARRAAGKFRIEFPLGKRLYESPGWLRSVRVSPRGDALAFVEHPVGGSDIGSVAVLDMNGDRKLLSGGWVSLEGLGWSPRGDEVWIAGTKDHAWANEIHGLDFSGRDRVILRLPGILRLHDISREGRVLLSTERWRYGILFRGPADEKERDLSWLDFSLVSDLSPDGRNLAFAEPGEAAGILIFAYMRKSDGSQAIRLGDCALPVFSPDQKRVLCESVNGDQFEVIATAAAESKSITPYGITQHGAFGWLPDGKEIFFEGYDGHSWRIYTQGLDGGKPRLITPEILPHTQWANLVSPDGKWLVGQDLEGKAWLYPVAGGSPHPLQGLEENEGWVNWSEDGRSAYIRDLGKVPTRVFRLDLSTGKKQPFIDLAPGDPLGMSSIRSVRVTPDGKSYAYTYERALSELYLVEGVK
jgi:eukaryotic-like serine/threonine-protein kinase